MFFVFINISAVQFCVRLHHVDILMFWRSMYIMSYNLPQYHAMSIGETTLAVHLLEVSDDYIK